MFVVPESHDNNMASLFINVESFFIEARGPVIVVFACLNKLELEVSPTV